MKRPWPKALAIVYDYKVAPDVWVMALACGGSCCNNCGWRSPLRTTMQEVEADARKHAGECAVLRSRMNARL